MRINTKIGNEGLVRTIFHNGEWITMVSAPGSSYSIYTASIKEAGENHLNHSVDLRNYLIQNWNNCGAQ
jgi:hypothetical protein